MKKEPKVLGFAQFGAYMHRDNGGKMKIAAYTSVNDRLKVEGGHDETVKIAQRTYKIVEEENAVLNGGKFYEKDVWNEQSGSGDVRTFDPELNYSPNSLAAPTNLKAPGSPDDLPAWGKVLKNFTDKIHDNLTALWIVVVAVAMLAAWALVSGLR